MPHHNTIRRVFQHIVNQEEFERLMEAYHQQATEADGEVLAMDGKALRGSWIAGQDRGEYVLSVYDGQTQQVKVQEVVETKENEIVAAPKALGRVNLAGKIVTGDASIPNAPFPNKFSRVRETIYGQSRRISRRCIKRSNIYLLPINLNLGLARSRLISDRQTGELWTRSDRNPHYTNQ